MSEPALPPEVSSFIGEYIDSVLQLEVLLLLHARKDAGFTSRQLSEELRIDQAWAQDQLANLCGRGLLMCGDQASTVYQYRPRDERLAAAVDALAKAYADRRVTVISQIFAKPVDKLRSFADAFRIRRESDR